MTKCLASMHLKQSYDWYFLLPKNTRLSLFLSYVSLFFQKIKAYLEGTSNLPFVVHATSGSGKTTVLAMAASKTKSWLSANVSVVVRYDWTLI